MSTQSFSQYKSPAISDILLNSKNSHSIIQKNTSFNSGISGSWYNPPQSGHGFFIESLGNNIYFMSWFAYDSFGFPTFIIGTGTTTSDNTIRFDMSFVYGMAWGVFDNSNLVTDSWGTVDITFNDCNSATVVYNSTYTDVFGTFYGTGNLPIIRLTSIENLPCTFNNGNDISISGEVTNSNTNNGISDVDVELLLNGIVISNVKSDSTGKYEFNQLKPDVNYDLRYSRNGFIPTNYSNARTPLDGTLFIETIKSIAAEPGGISGQVNNAVTGAGVAGVRIDFRNGVNVKSGPIAKTVVTDSDGQYSISSLNAGNYTGTLNGNDEFNTSFFSANNNASQMDTNQLGNIVPKLPPGEIRIVLSWGENPSDLDSNLTGPLSDNSSERFHVFYGNRGSLESSPFAQLDIDDVSSFGPETITISQVLQGTYRYSVRDFTNGGSTTSAFLAASSAQVSVFINDTIQTFSVPNEPGTLWTVFELNNSTITPVNNMSFGLDFVKSTNLNQINTDAELMINLPNKKLTHQ
jgi:hypothetical protein